MSDPATNKIALKTWVTGQRNVRHNLNWDRVNDGMINSVLNNLSTVRRSARRGDLETETTTGKAQRVILQELTKLSHKKTRESRNTEYQWVIVGRSYDHGRDEYSIQPIRAQGYAVKNWTLNYVFNQSFPSVKLTAVTNNSSENFLKSVFVSSNPCVTTNANVKGVCKTRTWSGSNYKVLKTGLKRVIVKKGAASPGVKNLADLIASAGSLSIAAGGQVSAKVLRARYLEAKRNGDYFQIFTCFHVNNNHGVYIMKPGDEDLAKEINVNVNGTEISGTGINMMKQLFAVDKFYFDKCCFWTCDRPAGLFAMLMGVPIIKKAVNVDGLKSTRLNYIPSATNERVKELIRQLDIIPNSTAKNCITEILDSRILTEASNDPRQLHSQDWYLKMCIFDTCHDFGHGNRSQRRLVELIKNVLISFHPQWLKKFINDVFSSIVEMEKIADVIIQRLAVQNRTSYDYDTPTHRTTVYDELTGIFNRQKMCYVYDCGTTPPVSHPFRLFRALLAAKLYDPSS